MMNARPITAGMIRAAGKTPVSSSAELTGLLNALAETVVATMKEFAAVPVQVEPDGLSISVRETPVADSVSTRLVSPRGPFSPIFTIDRTLVMALCDAAFGGSGTEAPHDGAERPLSKTERRIREALLAAFAAKLPEALALCFAMRFSKADDEERKPPTHGTVTVSFIAAKLLVYVFGYSGEVTLLLPEDQVARLLAIGRDVSAAVDKALRSNYLIALQESPIKITALLPAEAKPLCEVAGLRHGQLLKFKADASTPVLLMAEGQLLHKARVKPGSDGMELEIIDA